MPKAPRQTKPSSKIAPTEDNHSDSGPTPRSLEAAARFAAISAAPGGGSVAATAPTEASIANTAGGTQVPVLPRSGFLVPSERLSRERIIRTNDLLPIRFLELGQRAARAVGRIVVPNVDPRGDMLGTGFLIAPGLLMTNHHVLEEPFWAEAARVEFNAEEDLRGRPAVPEIFELDPQRAFFADKELDYAVVAVRPRSLGGASINLFGYIRTFIETGKIKEGEYANIIQHPNGRSKEISCRFNKILDYHPNAPTTTPDGRFLIYDSDTEGGSSGAPIFNDQWYLIGLHHSGVPRTAVVDGKTVILRKDGTPALKDDPDAVIDYIANEGIRSSRILKHLNDAAIAGNAMARAAQDRLDSVRASPSDGPLPGLEHVRAGSMASGPALGAAIAFEISARSLATFENAAGYNAAFLGSAATVPLPTLASEVQRDVAQLKDGAGTILLYDNFSVVMNRQRRTAFYAAWNIDGSALVEPGNRPRWALDPRIEASFQADDEIFSEQLNRGHIVRRKDVAWGARADRAHLHTFCLTNVMPQVHEFNDQEWGDLEDHILNLAGTTGSKVSLFAGPVFDARDPFYEDLRRRPSRGRARSDMRVPLQNWKVVAWLDGTVLKAAGFLQDQSDELERTGPLEVDFSAAKHKQVRIAHIQARTGLVFGDLATRDTLVHNGRMEKTITNASDIIV